MLKLIFFLVFLAIFSSCFIWLADNDGVISVEWLGYQIDTNVTYAILAIIIIFFALMTIFRFFLFIINIPTFLKRKQKINNYERSFLKLTEGFVALSQGDSKAACKSSEQVLKIMKNQPLALIMAAKSAELEGDTKKSEKHYSALLENKNTKFLAVKGLLDNAILRNSIDDIVKYGEQAYKMNSDAPAIAPTLLHSYKVQKDWDKAEILLKKYSGDEFFKNEEAAKIAYVKAQEFVESDIGKAISTLENAYKKYPAFTPVVILLAQLLFDFGKAKKAANIIESAWKNQPHPALTEIYLKIIANEKDKIKLKKVLKLNASNPSLSESNRIVALIYLANEDVEQARNYAQLALEHEETSVLCNLMAEIARKSGNSDYVIETWLARAGNADSDPAWICGKCGTKDKKWDLECNECESIDSVRWISISSLSGELGLKDVTRKVSLLG